MNKEEYAGTMLEQYYEDYIEKKYCPTYKEIYTNINFFATFSVGCSKIGDIVTKKKYEKILDQYIELIRTAGFVGTNGYKIYDVNNVISQALDIKLTEV